MKCSIILLAIIAFVASVPLNESQKWPWEVGKVYNYDVYSHTITNFDENSSYGSAFKAQFIVSVKAPGRLLAKLEKSLYAPVKAHILHNFELPSDLKYQPANFLDQTLEIFVDGGRVVSINVPSTLSVTNTNFIKGLISALQVDLSPFDLIQSHPNSFDRNTFQGLFKKMETDVTGQCETLYSVSPTAVEWHRELPNFTSEEDPVEIVKGRNYGSCQKRVVYYDGVSDNALRQDRHSSEEKQLIRHTFGARILAGKQGPLYKVEVTSTAVSNQVVQGKQNAEVFSYVKFYLNYVKQDTSDYDKQSGEYNSIDSLLYTYDDPIKFTRGRAHAVLNAKILIEKLELLLQNPNEMPYDKFLLTFQILVDALASLNSEQLTNLFDIIYSNEFYSIHAKKRMWIIFRDAVALTGTPDAYEQIKNWILNKVIESDEAAEMISVMAVSFKNPSIDLLKDFFNFSISSSVTELMFLNNSALLTSSISLYQFMKKDPFIEETVVPYLDKELKHAVEKGDTNKAIVYITALGNLASPSIIRVLAPYLEGNITVTNYIRTQMVANLKTLANERDEKVRAVLYSIVRNTAEIYEVRVAAALNLFLSFPTSEMMQVLALMTQYDDSTQVRAVLTSSITYAAGLKDPRFTELAKTSQSVLHMITKEKFDSTSTVDVNDDSTNDNDDKDFDELSWIDSKNHFLPKFLRSVSRHRGFDFTDEVTLSVSDVQELIDTFLQDFNEPTKSDPKFKFSVKKIIEMLNIKQAPRQPLEGALFFDSSHQQNLFTFNEKDIHTFTSKIPVIIENLLNGIDAHYSKVSYLKKMSVNFPLASGLPFLFEYKESDIITAQIRAAVGIYDKGKIKAGSLKTEIDVRYAYEVDSKVSFIDIFGDAFDVAGVWKELEFYIPLKINIESNLEQIKIQFEPLHDKDINIMYFNVIPFIAVYERNTIKFDMEPIKRSGNPILAEFKFGELTGIFYQVQVHSYSFDYKNLEKLIYDDLWTNIDQLLYQKDIALTEFNLKYLAEMTKVKSSTFTLYLGTLYNQKNSGEMGLASSTEHVEANSVARREEMMKKVSSGIDSATVQLFDFSARFDGPKPTEFIFTAAFASSVIDSKIQAAFFAHGSDQVNGVFKLDIKNNKIYSQNFKETLENELKLIYEANIQYQNNNLNIQGYGTRTKEYTELLMNDPMAKICIQDISIQNFYQKDCYNMLIKVYAPDYFKAIVTYKLDTEFSDLSNYTFSQYVNNINSVVKQSNSFINTDNNIIDIEAKAFYYDNYMDFNLKTKYGTYNIVKLTTTGDLLYFMSLYVPVTFESSFDWISENKKQRYCAIDDNKVWTFSGRSYDYTLTGSWHVVMVDDLKGWDNELVILARRPSANNEEVYISYKSKDIFFELEIKPDNIEVKTNANKTSDGTLTAYWDNSAEVDLLEYYTSGDGIYVFDIHETRIRLVYDKHRLLILTNYYGSTTGICGQSSTEIRDDYLTPLGLVDLPEHYGASFSLKDEFSDPKTEALKKEANLKAYQPKVKFTKILPFDADWSETGQTEFK